MLATIGPLVAEGCLAVTADALQRLADAGPRDRRSVIFESNARSTAAGNFQVNVSEQGPGGSLRMVVAIISFATREPVSRLLAFRFAAELTTMFRASLTLLLDAEAYDAVRDEVLDTLGDQVSTLVDDIDLEGDGLPRPDVP